VHTLFTSSVIHITPTSCGVHKCGRLAAGRRTGRPAGHGRTGGTETVVNARACVWRGEETVCKSVPSATRSRPEAATPAVMGAAHSNAKQMYTHRRCLFACCWYSFWPALFMSGRPTLLYQSSSSCCCCLPGRPPLTIHGIIVGLITDVCFCPRRAHATRPIISIY
jgi:hypothetical protein